MKLWLLLFATFAGICIAVESQEATPEAAPSTPTEESRFGDMVLQEPYTQDDLQVLVGNVQRPNGIVWFANRLYTACNGDYTLYEIDALSGQTTTLVYGVQNAHTLYAEAIPGGYALWVPDFDTNRLLRIDHRRAAPRAVAQNLDGPWGIARLNDNQFLISNIRANNVVAVDREGNVSELVAGLRAPAGIVYHDETLYVVNNGSARRAIEYVRIVDGAPAGPQPLVSGLQNASGLVMAEDGYLYFTYSLGTRGVVGRVQPDECMDGCTNEDVEIVVYTDLQSPLAGLAISPDMRLFVHTIFRPEIYFVDIYSQLPSG
jgi:hypothetical protein